MNPSRGGIGLYGGGGDSLKEEGLGMVYFLNKLVFMEWTVATEMESLSQIVSTRTAKLM